MGHKFDGSPYTQLATPARGDIQGVIKDISEVAPENQTKFAELEDLFQFGSWASKVRAVTASGPVTLANTDPMFIEIDPNGANRDVTLPAKSDDNHAYVVLHAGSANTLTLKRSGGATITTLAAGEAKYIMPSTIEDFTSLVGGAASTDTVVQLSSASPRVYTAGDTWSKPAGLVYVIVEVVGGGGAGGGAVATTGTEYACGSGGGGGGYSKKKILAASLASTETVTVGAGGTGVSGAQGNTGGTSSFGTHLQATGGVGGVVSAASATSAFITAAAGGIGSSGNINSAGDASMPGGRNFGSTSHGGGGGGSMMGGGGQGVTSATGSNGNAGQAYGGGGSGAANATSQSARAGAAGAAGVVIVWEYVTV